MELNEEQQFIINNIRKGKNVMVDAVAGTGKTTVVLSLAEELKKKNLLQITYNKSLKHEVRDKISKRNITNLTIHTYHSLCYCYYSNSGYTDIEMYKTVKNSLMPVGRLPSFDILIIDEVQDMTLLYFKFILKFLKDLKKKVTLLVLGDVMQGLYQFKGSDSRFLSLADKIWPKKFLKNTEFVKASMKTSYRITQEVANFINNVMIGSTRMLACKSDQKVIYIRNDMFNLLRVVYGNIIKLFDEGVKPQDIFIIGPSIKGDKSIIRRLENMLVQKNILCHVPMLEIEGGDERVSQGKIVFSTFHCVKGRERDYVFVVNFDNSYFKYYGRDLSREECPNTLYVATTRPKKGLYVLEGNSGKYDSPLPFLQMNHNQMKNQEYIDFRGIPQNLFSFEPEQDYVTEYTTPTDLIKFIPVHVIEDLSNIIDKMFICEETKGDELDIPCVVETKMGYFEEVSDMNGIAIPCMYFDYLKQIFFNLDEIKLEESSLYDFVEENKEMKKNIDGFIMDYISKLPETLTSASEYLKLASINIAMRESLYYRLKQIDDDEYTWLSDSVVNQTLNRMKDTINFDCQESYPKIEEVIFEKQNEDLHFKIDMFTQKYIPKKRFRFSARVDLITETTVWELKTTSDLTIDHKLQIIIYAWLWEMRPKYEEKVFRLYNIKNNHLLRLNASIEELNSVMVKLLRCRYLQSPEKSDAEFIKDCL